LQGSYTVIYNQRLRERMASRAVQTHYNHLNVLSMHALIACYSEGGHEWLRQVLDLLNRNVETMYNYLQTVEGVEIHRPEATYMLFPKVDDFADAHGLSHEALIKRFWDCGLAVQDGSVFASPEHLRINVASPSQLIDMAIERMQKHVFF
ncbi:MAG: aminotransferase class I/II-fold pyridoxal phosphate-dependent enzyme, partial [Eubacteriales bacterium]|nr:aminotransferase class I/II-fold pyridoxal phosphate-dependent enzyme [Eubacteriales bacterium]